MVVLNFPPCPSTRMMGALKYYLIMALIDLNSKNGKGSILLSGKNIVIQNFVILVFL